MSGIRRVLRSNRGFLIFMFTFGLIRCAVADYNPVPSGSMHPTIQEGDVVLVNRLAYNVKVPLTDIVLAHTGEPERGDIVTFSSPKDGVRLIKRLIGLPGDVIEMRDKQLTINGRRVGYQWLAAGVERLEPGYLVPSERLLEASGTRHYEVQWLDGMRNKADFGPITVPAGQYLMLGDNRDDSADSRYIGFVSRQLLIGRAERILVSAAIKDHWALRFDRFGQNLYR
jgi:signal peptidase I